MNILNKLEKAIIISSQAMYDEPFYNPIAMEAMIKTVVLGGAQGLRVAGGRDVAIAKNCCNLPIIGLTKPKYIPENFKEVVYITPTIQDVETIKEADIIAFDGTSRKRPENETRLDIINHIHNLNKLAMADISTFEEGVEAFEEGADIISTTLAGYTSYSKSSERPDFDLLQKLTKHLKCPIILEGRIWEPLDVKKAFELGAWAVVIGSAVTRPHHIVRRFCNFSK